MKLADFMEVFGPNEFVYVIIWEDGFDEGPIYEGSMYMIPYWIAKQELIEYDPNKEGCGASFRDSLGAKYQNRAGLVITVKGVPD